MIILAHVYRTKVIEKNGYSISNQGTIPLRVHIKTTKCKEHCCFCSLYLTFTVMTVVEYLFNEYVPIVLNRISILFP